jgi:hypothetical protein
MSVTLSEDGYPLRGRLAGTGSGRALPRSSTQRVCEEPSCGTVLSVYNNEAFCWQHADRHPYFVRAPRKRPSAA